MMVNCNSVDSVSKTENNSISTDERQTRHRWWSPMDIFKNVCYFYDFIKTGLFASSNKTQNCDGISDFFKRTTKNKQQKCQLSVPFKTTRKKKSKTLIGDLPKLRYLPKSCCCFVDHYQGKANITKRSITFISHVRSIQKQKKVFETLLRCAFDSNDNLRTETISFYLTDCNGRTLQLAPINVPFWLIHRQDALLKRSHYCISLGNKEVCFQLLIECNPMGLNFLYFCVQKLVTVTFDVHKIRRKQVNTCRYSIPNSFLNLIGKNELRDAKIKCLIYDTVYKFAVRKMEDTGATAPIPIPQQLTIPVYSATKTISNLLLNDQPFAIKSRTSSAASNDTKKCLTLRETIKNDTTYYAITKGNDDYYYQDALKRYRKGGTETLKRVNAEMSKTLKDGVGTLNNINIRVREYLNEMECSDKTLKSKVNINHYIENGENDNQGACDNTCNEKEGLRNDDEAIVYNKKRRIPTKSSINENNEAHEIIEIDKILKTEMENKPVSLENLYEVMRHIDNIDECRNVVNNYNGKKKDSDVNGIDNDKTDRNITNKLEKSCNEEEIMETFDFANTVNSQPQDVVQSKSIKCEGDEDARPVILEGDEKTCRTGKEKKKRKIKIITKKSMLSNTTIIEVQSPKTCNKTREEKLEELIKALGKKSGDERIRQIMEFLQEQTVSSKPFQSDLVEDIPRIRALTNIHGRLKDEELARDSLFEFQKKMCIPKKGKARFKLPTSLALTRTTLQESKKKLVHLRAQELFVPDRHINRLIKTTPLGHKKEKDITKLSPSEAHVRTKGRVAKYLEKRRKRLIQNALDYKRSHHGSAIIQQNKTATITMPKDPISIKKTLEKKASSNSDNDRMKNTLQLNINQKNDYPNYNNDMKGNVPLNNSNNPSKIELPIDAKSAIGSATVVIQDPKTNNTNKKFYDLKENLDYSKNPVEDYARDKHKWLRHKTDSPKSAKNSLYCFDILDEITPNDVQPLKSEYPRRDNILPEKIPHPCESFLGKLINRGNRKVLEGLLRVETPKIVCSSPNCITCKIKDNHVDKRSKNHNKNSASSERSFSSTDETASPKKKKNHLLTVPKRGKDCARSKVTTIVENGNEFRFKNFLMGRELAFPNDGHIPKAKSAGFEGAKKERLRKIHSDRSRSSSQRSKRHKPKNVKLNVPRKLGHSNEPNYSPSTSYKTNVESFTRQEVEEKLKQYMVDPYLHYPTSVTIMPLSVVYHTFDNTNGNPRMMPHSTARVPFSQQLQRQQREDHTNSAHLRDHEKSSSTLEQNPSYIFTSTTQDGETPMHNSQYTNDAANERRPFKDKSQWGIHLDKNQQKNFESVEFTDFLNKHNRNDVPETRLKKGPVTRGSVFNKCQCKNVDNMKSASPTKMEQLTTIENEKSTFNPENAEAAIILPKMICKRTGVKSAPSKHQFRGKTQKKLNRPATENTVKNVKNYTLQKQPLKKIKDKNRNVHFKDDIQKVIQSVEFKMVDILSDPRKHNVDAFMDVEKEITSVLAKFKTNDKTIEEEGGTTTSIVDVDDEMKETIGLKRSCLMPDRSGSNSTTTETAVSSLSIISKKDKQILTDICTVVKKTPPRKKINTGTGEKKQASKIISRLQTTSIRPETSLAYFETVGSPNEHRKISLEHVTEEKLNTNPLTQVKQKTLKTSSDEEKKESVPSFCYQAKPRSKGPLTNSGTTLPSCSSSYLPQHSLNHHNLRRRKSQTATCLRTFSPPSRAFAQVSSRSRLLSVTSKPSDKAHYTNKIVQPLHLPTTDDNINMCKATLSKCNWKNQKDTDVPLQPKIMETSFNFTPKYEIEKIMADSISSVTNVCERETIVEKSGGSGDKGDPATVFPDDSEIRLPEDNAEMIRLDEKFSELILEENVKNSVVNASKSWTDTDLTTYTDSFHVISNSASLNASRRKVANFEDTNGLTTEEKCFITAAYEPKPHLSEKIDATLAKIEAATKTIEKAMQSADNIDSITQETERTIETKVTLSEKESSSINHSEYVCEIANGEGDNFVSGKGGNCHDNILYFLDNLTTLTTESNTPLPITIAKRKCSSLSSLLHFSSVYYEPTIFYCTGIYHKAHSSKCLRSGYHQEMLQLLGQTQAYAREEYIYDKNMEKQLQLLSRNRFNRHEFERHDAKLTNVKENGKMAKNYAFKARILDLFYGLLFTLLYFGLIFNYMCHFIE
ncbi:uncharacterized protein LOC108734518 isoform X3 [Agrilus planipennis]|uniref:Uncharacterized protein LOC108734518 isoform X3 n=1 Tax=Agrilus planipennis TaxID=224129 RepID=A0A1W4WNB5_AGRPL|nr:uncharacterized protein LOC108734518 isoform X3 [Agrilus planipennis]